MRFVPPDAPGPADDLDEAWHLLSAASGEPDASLAERLYALWFHDGGGPRAFPSPGAYAAATCLPELFASGWQVAAPAPGGLFATGPDGRREFLAVGHFALAQPAAEPVPGMGLRRLVRTAEAVGGFWHLWSDGWRRAAPARIVRLYLPLRRGTELEAARRLVPALPPDAVWAAKFLSGMHSTGRRDPALLYLPDPEAGFVGAALGRLADLFGGPRVRLARPFAGAWLAPDPGDDRSFGQALSEALAAAWQATGAGRNGGRDRFRQAAMAALAPLLPAPGQAVP